MPHSDPQHQVAKDRNVLPRVDLCAARWTAGPGYDEIESLAFGNIDRRCFVELGALGTPVALHHDREPVDDHIQEATDHECKSERDRDEHHWQLGKHLEHALSP